MGKRPLAGKVWRNSSTGDYSKYLCVDYGAGTAFSTLACSRSGPWPAPACRILTRSLAVLNSLPRCRTVLRSQKVQFLVGRDEKGQRNTFRVQTRGLGVHREQTRPALLHLSDPRVQDDEARHAAGSHQVVLQDERGARAGLSAVGAGQAHGASRGRVRLPRQ